MPSEVWYFSLKNIYPGLMYRALALVILEQMWTGLLNLKKPQKLVCKRPFCDFGLWEPPLTRIQLEFFVKAKSKKGMATTKVASLFDALLEARNCLEGPKAKSHAILTEEKSHSYVNLHLSWYLTETLRNEKKSAFPKITISKLISFNFILP